ncbi:pyridoxal-phosphate-dependent aminotransferase family protein [Sulfurospirillum arcachonense]|uniref:pyridoxal-phosphate-dependent aminotransferase family protein n=1 Tax=Sulfurospirillum arcachonense TaxID=57666 RepID=UPI000469F3CE|nr:alanine--glyoxylate aminotransferase family protein [Sulfurospirillum arcachonense]
MLLLTPGPTPVPEDIRMAMSGPTIHHRTPEFEEIFEKTRELLKELFDMEEVLMLASSGTGAMEATVLNLCKTKALTINSGKFGERFGKICEAYGKEYSELKYDWDTPSNVADVVNAIKNDESIDAIFIQICESAGGLRHPVEQIAKEVKKIRPNIMVVADGITAVGVEKIDTTNIDALISGSQKALMLPPGLALIGLSGSAMKVIEEGGVGYYLNLKTELKKQKQNTTAYTAATTLIIGLKAMLEKLHEDGFDKLYSDTKKRSLATKKALEALDLKIFPKVPADAMSAVYDEDAAQIRKILKTKYDVNMAGGQDHVKTTLFRINHMGLVAPYEAAWTLNAIEMALDEIGRRPYDGAANAIFSKELYND